MTRNEIKRFRIFLSTHDDYRVGSSNFNYHSFLNPVLEANVRKVCNINPVHKLYGYSHTFDYVKRIEPVIVKQFKCELDYFLRNYVNSVNLWVFKPESYNRYYANIKYF